MSVIATDTQRYSNVVKYEDEPSLALTREVVVVNDAAKTLKLGMLLGKVTATGKYKEAVGTATDGSQNPVAVVVFGFASRLLPSAELSTFFESEGNFCLAAGSELVKAEVQKDIKPKAIVTAPVAVAPSRLRQWAEQLFAQVLPPLLGLAALSLLGAWWRKRKRDA